jgi:hemerythrin superfamily protein
MLLKSIKRESIMNAIDFLIKEHNKVRSLFEDLNDPSHREETQKKIFLTIRDELLRHEEMEQKVWYPNLKAHKKWQEKIKHLKSEEHSAKKFIEKLKTNLNSDNWQQDVSHLQEEVEHHANEEETKLFPLVRETLDEEELQHLGEEMKEFKENYESKQ